MKLTQAGYWQNPAFGGKAVYSARVMTNIDLDDFMPESSERKAPASVAELVKATGLKIYPNPNDGNMRLDYYLKDSQEGLMLIFDVTGKLIKSIRMNSNTNSLVINETELKQGIYLFKILVNGELIVSDKLVIIK
jgi:hypothetical protein